MKTLKYFILFILFSTPVFASDYLIEKPDGSVVIVGYIEGSSDSLETVLKDLGLLGLPIQRLSPSDFPSDKKDRKYWKLNDVPIGKKIVIDTAKKQADETAKQVKDERKRALLKMTPSEYAEAKDLGLVR